MTTSTPAGFRKPSFVKKAGNEDEGRLTNMIISEMNWIYLDDQPERERLQEAIRQIRQRACEIARRYPREENPPKDDGWTIAATLAHLHALDTLGRWQLQAALVGIRPRFSAEQLDRLNDWQRRFFSRTPIETTLGRIDQHTERLCQFVADIPLAKLSTAVWLARSEEWSTIERAAQIYFWHHWQEHLTEIEAAAPGAPPSASAN